MAKCAPPCICAFVHNIMGSGCDFTKVVDTHKNAVSTFNMLKRVLCLVCCCLEPANARTSYFVTPNEVHQNLKNNLFYELEISDFSSFDGLRLESEKHFYTRLWALGISTLTREHE